MFYHNNCVVLLLLHRLLQVGGTYVILNLIKNAFYAMDEKKKQNNDGYDPTVMLTTKMNNEKVEIKVADNGNDIPQTILDKIYQPFLPPNQQGRGQVWVCS